MSYFEKGQTLQSKKANTKDQWEVQDPCHSEQHQEAPTNKPQMQQTVKGMDLTHSEYDTCYDKSLLSHVLSCCDIFDIFTQKKFKKANDEIQNNDDIL